MKNQNREGQIFLGRDGFMILFYLFNNTTKLSSEEVGGMEFSSLDDAQSFYLSYAHMLGFNVRFGGTKSDPNLGMLLLSIYIVIKKWSCWRNTKCCISCTE